MPDICGNYLCPSDVDNWPIGTTDAQKTAIITKVEQLIDKITDTHWYAEEFDIKINGNGKNRIFLPLETDIVTVEHVYISCVELDSNWYTHDKNSILLDPCIADGLWGKNYVTDGKFSIWQVSDPTHDLYYWSEIQDGSSTVNRETLDFIVGSYGCRLDIDVDGGEASIKQTLQLTRNRTFKLLFYYKNTITKKTDTTPRPLADSATATTLRDVDVFDIDDEFNGAYISIVSGTGTDNGFVEITDTDGVNGDIIVAEWPGTQPDGTSRYIIVGTLKVKLYNPADSVDLTPPSTSSLQEAIVDGETVWVWEAGDKFISLDPVTAWTLYSAEFTSHTDFVIYDLVFANGGGSSYSIYIDDVGILSAGIAALLATEDYLFPRGYNNIWVEGTHGESGPIPEAIKQAAVILAKWENDPTLYTTMGLKKSEKIGDYSYTTLAGAEDDVLTGIMEADMLLRHYIKRKPVLMAP